MKNFGSEVLEQIHCPICFGHAIAEVVCLPNYPLGGHFREIPFKSQVEDLRLWNCSECNHFFLRTHFAKGYLYDSGYVHASLHATALSFPHKNLINIISKYARLNSRKHFKIIDIGGDSILFLTELAKTIDGRCDILSIDPQWSQCPINQRSISNDQDNIFLQASFVEDVPSSIIEKFDADIIIFSSTLEHIRDATSLLKRICELTRTDSLFVVEVPDFNSICLQRRFDLLIHDHVHYFHEDSLRRAAILAGFRFFASYKNPRYLGGSIIFILSRRSSRGHNH